MAVRCSCEGESATNGEGADRCGDLYHMEYMFLWRRLKRRAWRQAVAPRLEGLIVERGGL